MKGINISGEVMIIGNYGPQIKISNKNIKDEWESMYIDVQFTNGQKEEKGTLIQIHKGFLSFYKTKEGLAKPKLVIQEYTVISKAAVEEMPDDPELDLPF